MKNLELEADKANKYVEDTLLPKKATFEDSDGERNVTDEENTIRSQNQDEPQTEMKERNKSKPRPVKPEILSEKLPTDNEHKKEK